MSDRIEAFRERNKHPSEGPDCDHVGCTTLEETGEPEIVEGVTIPVECTACGKSFEYYFDYVGLYDPEEEDYVFQK